MDFSSCGVFGGLLDFVGFGAFGVSGAVSAFVFRAGLFEFTGGTAADKTERKGKGSSERLAVSDGTDDDSEDEAASSGVVPKTSKIESVAASSSGVVLRLAMQRVRVTFETLNIPQPEEICLIMPHILEPQLTDLRTLSKDEPCSTG